MIFPVEYNQPAVARTLFPQYEGFHNGESHSLPVTETSYPAQLFTAEKSAPTIILFPAPNAPLPSLEELADGLLQQQINLLVISNPPWDEAKAPSFSLQNYADNGAALLAKAQALLQQEEISGALFTAGHGLGIIPAITAIQRTPEPLKGIFLEGPVCDLQNYLALNGASSADTPKDTTAYSIELEHAMQSISKPTMIFHGARDPFSTATQAEKLQSFSSARKKQFFVVPGAETPSKAPLCHWAGPLYFSTIRTFIDTICGTNTWRQRRREKKQQ